MKPTNTDHFNNQFTTESLILLKKRCTFSAYMYWNDCIISCVVNVCIYIISKIVAELNFQFGKLGNLNYESMNYYFCILITNPCAKVTMK